MFNTTQSVSCICSSTPCYVCNGSFITYPHPTLSPIHLSSSSIHSDPSITYDQFLASLEEETSMEGTSSFLECFSEEALEVSWADSSSEVSQLSMQIPNLLVSSVENHPFITGRSKARLAKARRVEVSPLLCSVSATPVRLRIPFNSSFEYNLSNSVLDNSLRLAAILTLSNGKVAIKRVRKAFIPLVVPHTYCRGAPNITILQQPNLKKLRHARKKPLILPEVPFRRRRLVPSEFPFRRLSQAQPPPPARSAFSYLSLAVPGTVVPPYNRRICLGLWGGLQ
ncbi:hypothetical protein JAAARDRAFT_192495 [Jaapia argillacea MUCL 33604]|uniref:Uncharacterized protein n=1 Tax=Jaapia argillacea MUCL 33604 TaxID=933084 RepID=A0A067Q8N4_9AGAM|nr:hypothetical protein JAAARDRAFT_192495 [Jaapia argillacea MUCL 33604]